MVRVRLANVRELLTHVHVNGEKKNQIEEMMESYVAHCENAKRTGTRYLLKIFQTKRQEQKRARKTKLLLNKQSTENGG